MKVRIHRGAKQIGGTCIEVEAQGKRIVLDIGQPLDCPDAQLAEMPDVKGFKAPDPSLLGVVLSHPHLDHYGLASRLPPNTMFLMGEAAERILTAAAVFIPSAKPLANVTHLEDGKPLRFGPFTITPFLMDHSAYDSYAVLVEADGRRLFYTGDLRGHGRKGKLFDKLVTHPPQNVDVLLMEGTTLKRLGTEDGFPTEGDIENKLVDIFKATKGMPLVWCSGQNIDRLVTVFRAAKRSGRQLIVDMYAAHVLDATQKASIPQAKWKELRVFLPQGEKRRIKNQEAYKVSDQYRPYRIFPEHLAEVTARSVMLFRPSMKRDVESAGCLDGACLVYSMWDGYLKKEERFLTWLKERGIPLHQCHTSGHASLPDLKRLRKAFESAVVVPIHTEQPSLYEKNFGNVHVYEDGEWWEVTKGSRMKTIIRSFNDGIPERVKSDFDFLIERVEKENGELDLRLRNNYFNLYYKGNSLAKVNVKDCPYLIEINKAFINVTKDDSKEAIAEKKKEVIDEYRFGSPKTKGDYLVYSVDTKNLHAFLSKSVINKLYSRIKDCNFSEELVFEQLLIADNRNRRDFIIIDRQIQGGALGQKRIDLLALRHTGIGNKFNFEIIEVKMGNNPELSGDVADQIQGYVQGMESHFDEFKACYEKTYSQMKTLGLLKAVDFDQIDIERPVHGVIVVGGYPGLANTAISILRREHPALLIKAIDYKL